MNKSQMRKFGRLTGYFVAAVVCIASAAFLGGCLAVAAGAGAGYIAGTEAADHHDGK